VDRCWGRWARPCRSGLARRFGLDSHCGGGGGCLP
jgi:hypothetical protein